MAFATASIRTAFTLLCVLFLAAPLLAGSMQERGSNAMPAGLRYTADGRYDAAGVARSLYTLRAAPSGLPRIDAARKFVDLHAAELGLPSGNSSLSVVDEQNAPGGTHVRFQQMLGEIPVHRGEIRVSLNRDAAVTMVLNSCYTGPPPRTLQPALGPGDAISAARRHLGVTGQPLGGPDRSSLEVFPLSQDEARISYRVNITTDSPYGDWEVIVDAASGEILQTEDLFVCFHDQVYARGSGYVYLPDPVSAAGLPYGSSQLVDSGDSDNVLLASLRTLVPLDSLLVRDGLYSLTGPGCTVVDIEPPVEPQSYAVASPDSFRFARSQPGFEAVMAYYHATTAYRRVLALGFSAPALSSLRIDPHGFDGKDNSHYSPSGNWIGLGTGGVDDGEDASVIWHEYGHAIHWNLAPGWGGGEMAALGEGYADYWAGSYVRSLGLWDRHDDRYNWLFLWDGHNEFWTGRRLDDSRPYPFGSLSVHAAGSIWASTLMGIRGDLGRNVADRLVLKSLLYLGYGATAVDAAHAILQADRDMFGGQHLPTLFYWLRSVKGFLPSAEEPSILVVIDVPQTDGDSLRSEGKAVGAPQHYGPVNLSAFSPEGTSVAATTFAGLDTARLSLFSVVLLLGGLHPEPFNDPARRSALVSFAERGGKLLVEGGEVGFYFRFRPEGEVDRGFREKVLHIRDFVGDADGRGIVASPQSGPLFDTPHMIPALLEVGPGATFADRDALTPSTGEPGTVSLAGWQGVAGASAIISHSRSDGSRNTLFFAFSLAALADSTAAISMLENGIAYLLEPSPSTAALDDGVLTPETVSLGQNFPNPFNPATTISFTLPGAAVATLRVYAVNGQEVATLADGVMPPGLHTVVWNARSASGAPVASGTYFYRLSAVSVITGDRTEIVRRMVLLR